MKIKDENYFNPTDEAIESGLLKLFRVVCIVVAVILSGVMFVYFNS